MSSESAPSPTVAGDADFEIVVGLEVHCQLKTRSKAFCGCPTRFGNPPNTNTCPTCLGLPGALPAFNERAFDLGLRIALALECDVRERSVFARKNYFYADLPKGYQISQHEEPMALGGHLDIEPEGEPATRIRLTRIHLEEDAGKSIHDASDTTTFVDFNRSGAPLAEIVTEPDFRSVAQVHAYLTSLRRLVRWLDVSDGNMEQGSLRCDCNVSVRRRGEERLGTKVELKNLNSFRSVVRAIEHEGDRQAAILRRGGSVEHGTRLWDEARRLTRPMRRKELAHDYRYFPDPDLLPLEPSESRLERARSELLELPRARRGRFVGQLGLPEYDADVLTASRAVADHFEEVASACGDARAASKWVMGEVMRDLSERAVDLEAADVDFAVPAARLAGLIALVDEGAISFSAGKRVFAAMAETGRDAVTLVDEMGLRQLSDESELRAVVQRVIDEQPAAVADWKGGNPKTFGFFVGQVMRSTKGKANPQVVNRLLEELLADA